MSEHAPEDHLLAECNRIAGDSLYTSQAHFECAASAKRRGRWLLTLPAAVAAVIGILTAVGLPGWLGAFSAAAALVAAVASILGVDREEGSHCQAGNSLTALRHEARALADTSWRELTHEQLAYEVRRLSDRYGALITGLPTTDNKAFGRARKRIKAGLFAPDQGPPKEQA